MSSRSEGTNAQHISNFHTLIEVIDSLGSAYQPYNRALLGDSLMIQYRSVIAIENSFRYFQTLYSDAIDRLHNEYFSLLKFITGIEDTFKTNKASDKALDTLKSVIRRIKGGRSAKTSIETDRTNIQDQSISASRISYVTRVSNFAALMHAIKTEAVYKPDEALSTVEGLQKKLVLLNDMYQNVSAARTLLETTHIRHSEAFYHPETGLFATIRHIKFYAKKAYGQDSSLYNRLTLISFSTKGI